MAEDQGHFEQGAWITGGGGAHETDIPVSVPVPGPTGGETSIEERIADLSGRMGRDIGELFHLTRDLLTTEEGHRHIGQMVAHAQDQLEKVVNDLLEESREIPEKEANHSLEEEESH